MSRERLTIHEVGPRDGLQSQAKVLTPEQRVRIIRALLAAGEEHIQVAAFVSPKAVPAMAGADRILAALQGEPGHFTVLVPNLKGYELAQAAGASTVEMVLYASEGMAQANARMSRRQAEDMAVEILSRARSDGINIVTTISVAFECPFDGPVKPGIVEELTERFLGLGAQWVVIADTIGAANPALVAGMMNRLAADHGADRLGCHFHDTRAMGLANVYAALEEGVRRFDTSVAGVGGCPFATGASGNVATEDVVMMVEQMGFDTGINMIALLEASELVANLTGTATGGRALPWLKQSLAESARGREAHE
jgi:hydroxymethylglutaryl-CoA lyase